MVHLLGVDVSIWQGLMNWAQAVLAGARYAILRATSISASGNPYEDAQFERNVDLAPEHLIVAGLYHYFRPQFDPIMQADWFMQRFVDLPFTCFAVPDIETAGGLAPPLIEQRAHTFVNELISNGHMVLPYTRGSFWNPYLGNPTWARSLPLWVARYSSLLTHPWGDGLYRPLPWHDWLFWQWSADGNWKGREFGAESHHIDLNRFKGDIDDLRRLLGQAPPPGPGQPIPVELRYPAEALDITLTEL